MKIKLIGINARYTHSCLALFYVRNELVNNCSDPLIQLEQYTINEVYYELVLSILREEMDYYFFSATIWNSDLVTAVVRDILLSREQGVCVVGGPQADVVGRDVANERCISVIGEIERVSASFYSDLENGSVKKRYECTELRGGFSSPYCDSDLVEHLNNRHIYYETSRGCPFSCSYCLSSAKKGVYHKDLAEVRRELEHLLSHNPKEIRFVDRTFNDNLERCLTIWKFLMEHECDTSFHFEMSPDRFSGEMFTFLKTLPMGKFEFEMGIQSTHQKTLEAIGRPVDTLLAHDNISRLAELNNIHLHVDLILGLPFETEESFLQSFRHVFAMGPHYVQMGLLKILPDTPLSQSAADFGFQCSETIPYPVFSNKWLDPEAMQRMYWFSQCVERFMNNRYFTSLWEYYRRTEADIVDFFWQIFVRCQKVGFFQRSPTQQYLTDVLVEHFAGEENEEYLLELLRYDWLRCGHKFLPGKLAVTENRSSRVVKREVFSCLAEDSSTDLAGAQKNYYFRKGFFHELSGGVLKDLGYAVSVGRHCLCFLPDREKSLNGYCKTVHFVLAEREK